MSSQLGKVLSTLLVTTFLGLSSPTSVNASVEVYDQLTTTQAATHVPGEFVVKFKSHVPAAKIKSINANHGVKVLSTSAFMGFKRINVPHGKSGEALIKAYNKNPNVEYAELNYLANAHYQPNDPYYSLQWHFDNPDYPGIQLEAAWDSYLNASATTVVAVLDTGVAYENHGKFAIAPDLTSTTFVPGYDFIQGDSHPNDENSHGTHVTGTIAQSTNNNLGTAGIAFNASVMPVRVLNKNGSGSHTAIANGIYFAVNNGADVINMSLGGGHSSTLENAIAYAHGAGVTVIASSGNDGPGSAPNFPAAYDDYVIAVAATRYDETVSYYSSWGSYVDISAPGGDTSVNQNGDPYVDGVLQQTFNPNSKNPKDFSYWFFQGTSMAAPHVSGVAAMLVSLGAGSPAEVRTALESTARDITASGAGWDSATGHGLIQARAASDSLTGNTAPAAVISNFSCIDLLCSYDGASSNDNDGTVTGYSWSFGDGASSTTATGNHLYASAGTYNISLTVTDNDGANDSAFHSEDVSDGIVNNNPPTASFSTPVCIDLTCPFDGSGSSDSDGNITTYSWDFGDGNGASGSNPSDHTYASAGTYAVTLTVTDDHGATDDESKDVTVSVSVNNDITLSVSSYLFKGKQQRADLTWNGATSANVDIKRDGSTVSTTSNDGAYTDKIGRNKGTSFTYLVCDAGTSNCSNSAVVNF